MKITLLISLVFTCHQLPRALSSIESLLKQYKKKTLPLREDKYQGNLPIWDSYDYIIVGAGPSGCVLANRLTEHAGTTVLLLEAGPETSAINDIPIFNLLFLETDYNWKFTSQYNPRVCRAMNYETCPWPSGKGIGGGTAINGLIFTRGNKNDFDDWANHGNIGWSYNEVLKYFKKIENTRILGLRNSSYRGKEGPIWVDHSPYRTNASLVFLQAGKELGYPEIDFNEPYKTGFAKMQLSLKNGFRSNAPNAYLKPVKKRTNLHIVQRAVVSKVKIESKEARGVEFYKKGKRRFVEAKKEVILCAGTFGTPKLLMLSGIGPKVHLESMNIEVIKDLPGVGNNLQEHIGVTHLVFLADRNPNFIPDYRNSYTPFFISLIQHQLKGNGPPSSGGVDSLAYVSSRYTTKENPDIELLFIAGSYSSDLSGILRKTIGIRDDIYHSFYKELENQTTLSVWVMASYPKSKGTFRLSSRNYFDPPIITNNFLNNTEDLNVVIDGIRKSIEIAETEAMKSYGVRLYRRKLPGCEHFKFNTDEYWGCTVREITAQYHHQCCTCRMGPEDDSSSVVDPRLRVRGIKRMRVADASIMPAITAGHTQAPAYMIGEKAADMIKEDNL